jgi:hypothetical protein
VSSAKNARGFAAIAAAGLNALPLAAVYDEPLADVAKTLARLATELPSRRDCKGG